MIIRVFIMEEQSITRAGLRSHLEGATDVDVIGEAADAVSGLRGVNNAKPAVVLLGSSFCRQESDQVIRKLLDITPQPGVLILADHEDARSAERSLKAGALGYVSNGIEAPALASAIRQVARQQVVVSPEIKDALLQRLSSGTPGAPKDPSQVLSQREMEVFVFTGKGLEAKEIAGELSISPRTVDVHRANIRYKLGIQGAHELMRYAMLWEQHRQHAERVLAFERNASPVLLVEDDEVDILNVDRALKELGSKVKLVVKRTAEEALKYLRASDNPRPGLILLDIKMPGMNGREFLTEVRKDSGLRTMPVVVLTSSKLDEDKHRMHALGITGYLTKPATSAEFVERLDLLAQYWSVNEPPPIPPTKGGAHPR
ncbi:MAG: response regulator [Verrucomicrobiales bacterium]|nr:response regulator [Verrucomicrobiales bacterium]